ncbi:aldehyde dehydrogenase [Mycobacterium fragae]|uniref:aldehyde dehydrogenase n=1 Tax=Mycobacterium fragae TaxID=1260918 RepID=UPI0026CE8052
MNISEPELFIDGGFRTASGVEPVIDATTEQLLGEGPSADIGDIDDAVAASRRALREWSTTPAVDRARLLERFADALTARAVKTSELCTREIGSPITFSRIMNGLVPAAVLRYYAALISKTDGEEIRHSASGNTIVRREPVGVVGAIVPWNVPQVLAAMKLAPALAAGCTVVLKAAPETALDARAFGEAAAEAGLPPGVLNVTAGGGKAGAYLVSHPDVDKVAFTGSSEVGRVIAETCGRLMRPVTLELGGKSAAIILDDADLELTMRGLRTSAFANNGQMCYASTRVLAPQSRYREVVAALADMTKSLRVGDPLDETTEIGPLASARHRERVLGYIEIGKADGARLVTGGGAPTDQPRGWYAAPTVFADVDNSARIAREEIFGPVLTVTPYGTDAEAVDLANDSDFGLAGTVWSSDEARATEIARGVRTGTIGINGYQLDVDAPFGGVKASGVGRELGPEGLAAYQTLKSIFRLGSPAETT